MPLDRLVLIIVIVIAAAGATVWIAASVAAGLAHPVGFTLLVPAALVAWILLRVIQQRRDAGGTRRYDDVER